MKTYKVVVYINSKKIGGIFKVIANDMAEAFDKAEKAHEIITGIPSYQIFKAVAWVHE